MEFDANTNPDAYQSADEFAAVVEDVVEAVGEYTSEELEVMAARQQIARDIQGKLDEADRGRDGDESRWLTAFRNYRGQYDKKYRESEKSSVFVKVTKTKVLAAYGQLVDVVFNGNKFPIGVEPTHVPEGIAEFAHLKTGNEPEPSIEGTLEPASEAPESPLNALMVGHAGDGLQLPPGATLEDANALFLGSLKDKYSGKDGEPVLAEGPAILPGPQISPAKQAGRNMEKLIHDQIEESNGSVEVRNSLFEAALLGTGIVKGPFNFNKTLHRWTLDEEGNRVYEPELKRVPRIEFVSVWDFYPDPNARNMEEAEWVIQRHRLNTSQLRALKSRPHFDKSAINTAIKDGANYTDKDFETLIRSEEGGTSPSTQNRFEVLEYWGTLDVEDAEKLGLLSEEMEDTLEEGAEVQVNIWTCNGHILRAVANPFTPTRLPYLAFPYEKNPYSFFGIGVAENMEDSQQIMNGHARMAIDNLALAGSLVLDVDESALAPGQNMEIYPGKIFRRQAGMPGQAVHGLTFPNTAHENMAMFDRFRQLADESTGMPSYSHGQTGVQSTTRTAAGMSMLMGAASLNIKTVIKNLDDYLLKQLGEAYFNWNMAFYEGDLEIAGDLEVRALGTASLIQKEVRSQRLTTVLQTVQNPALAPFVKLPTILKELAYSLDLNPDEILNSPDEAAIYAQIIGMAQAGAQPAGMPPGEAGAGPIGAPAMPGEESFSGTPQLPPMPEGMPQ